jgi:hypothetical protein
VDQSPLDQLLEALDDRDTGAVSSLLAPACEMLLVDGRRAIGPQAVRDLITEFLAATRSMQHRVTARWHVDDVWIAEVEATYVLQDWLELRDIPRAFVVRTGPPGVVSVHAYGAHEHPISDHRTGDEGMRIGARWIPPL